MTILEDFKIIQKIGEGSFSTVYKGNKENKSKEYLIEMNML